jgi:hypothetical protein
MANRKVKQVTPELVEKYSSAGIGIPTMANLMGVAENTLKNHIKERPEIGAAWRLGSAKGHKFALKCLANCMQNGNIGAIIFYLTNKFPNEWQNTNRGAMIINNNSNHNAQFGQMVSKDPAAGRLVTELISRISNQKAMIAKEENATTGTTED